MNGKVVCRRRLKLCSFSVCSSLWKMMSLSVRALTWSWDVSSTGAGSSWGLEVVILTGDLCRFRRRRAKAQRPPTLSSVRGMRRAGGSWGTWSCSVLCAWSGSPPTPSASTRRTFLGLQQLCVTDGFTNSSSSSSEPVSPSWPTTCSTATCAITAATPTSSGNKQVGLPQVPFRPPSL